jgi:methionyl-tRNA formyltransferase
MTDQKALRSPRKSPPCFYGQSRFFGASLRVLNEAFEICAVYTQPPRKAGRGMKLQPTAVPIVPSRLACHVSRQFACAAMQKKKRASQL